MERGQLTRAGHTGAPSWDPSWVGGVQRGETRRRSQQQSRWGLWWPGQGLGGGEGRPDSGAAGLCAQRRILRGEAVALCCLLRPGLSLPGLLGGRAAGWARLRTWPPGGRRQTGLCGHTVVRTWLWAWPPGWDLLKGRSFPKPGLASRGSCVFCDQPAARGQPAPTMAGSCWCPRSRQTLPGLHLCVAGALAELLGGVPSLCPPFPWVAPSGVPLPPPRPLSGRSVGGSVLRHIKAPRPPLWRVCALAAAD